MAQKFLVAIREQAERAGLLSDEHFTVDGTLIEAWAARRSYRAQPEAPSRGSGARGRKLLRDTHRVEDRPGGATVQAQPRGEEAKPSYLGHVITENRNGLVVEAMVTESAQKAEREAALPMLGKVRRRGSATLGADKAYQEEAFIARLREQNITPHVAEYAACKNWPNWLRPEERQHPGFARSQQKRKLVEQVFGWIKASAGMGEPSCEADGEWTGCFGWRLRRTTWCGCEVYWPARRKRRKTALRRQPTATAEHQSWTPVALKKIKG